MLKQLEAYIALRPRVVVPAHGPVGDVRDLETMVDYLLLGRQKVRMMMEQGLGLPDIIKQFNMNEYKGWDRGSHFEWMAETRAVSLSSPARTASPCAFASPPTPT
jgi:hypothetical protein